MTRPSDLAPFMVQQGQDIGFHQGTVTAWDSTSNENTIDVAGSPIENVPALSIGDSIMMSVGDHVGLLRFKSTYFILGRITLPGQSNAFGIRAVSDPATGFLTSGSTYGDLSVGPGPILSNVYVGSSRRCLVFLSAGIYADQQNDAAIHVAVSGASTIAPPSGPGAHTAGAFVGSDGTDVYVRGSMTKALLLTASDGLNSGLNTFTMKYMARVSPGIDDSFFSDRVIIVFPF